LIFQAAVRLALKLTDDWMKETFNELCQDLPLTKASEEGEASNIVVRFQRDNIPVPHRQERKRLEIWKQIIIIILRRFNDEYNLIKTAESFRNLFNRRTELRTGKAHECHARVERSIELLDLRNELYLRKDRGNGYFRIL
jgi:hypothetical protein